LLDQPKLAKLTIAVPQRYVSLFFAQVQKHPRAAFLDLGTDCGIPIRPGELWPDPAYVDGSLTSWVNSWGIRLQELQSIPFDLVIADASPLACELARRRNLPCALVSNFEWHAQFVGLGLRGPAVDAVERAYASVTQWLRYPLPTPSLAVPAHKTVDVPMCTRTASPLEVEALRSALPYPRVLLTMGGLIRFDEPLQLPSIEGTLIITTGMHARACNASAVVDLSVGVTDALSHVGAADLIVTKAGWGTVAEAASARKPLLVLRRNGVPEDEATLGALESAGLGQGFDLWDIDRAIATAVRAGLEPTPGLHNDPTAVARACLALA
jgi:hypothetical protein